MTLLEVNKLILSRLSDFLNQLSDQDYQKQLTVFNGSSLGEHTRHIIEFYQCLIAQYSQVVVSYDLRERKQVLQQSTLAALEALAIINADIDKLELDTPLLLEVNAHIEEDTPQQILTNLHRELHYVLDHTIHHMALITVGVRSSFPHITLPTDFGVAPSTIRSRSSVQG